ncbi:hypothetical protein SAMN05444412_11791 [Rhodonellum ikkaensis]|uniref:Ribosomal protein L32 n=1 Tax=Rhodonellum ikkaensis TaxID=336829 RepID=A0A1H3TH09_9BACT|nr:hypothetical protein SAMN05444412_11791 [Rhodonellum ikkaensis]
MKIKHPKVTKFPKNKKRPQFNSIGAFKRDIIYLKIVCFLSGPTETILMGTPSSASRKKT